MKRRVEEFNEILFSWNNEHYRHMDWRPKNRDVKKSLNPYCILVSEIMLQQTQVDRVREKYKLFVKEFPDVYSLASAPLGDVLKLWSGLGYNRRAKHLHATAKIIVSDYSGIFPKNYLELQKLPGIGKSTAAALMAFTWNEAYPMIDTNVRRMLVRCFFKEYFPSDVELFKFAQQMIPDGRGRAWNYAMLDLGATECTARGHSTSCPLLDIHGEVGDFVYKKPQSKFKGSKRSYRGKLLKALAEVGRISRTEAVSIFIGSSYDGNLVINELIKEGLIREIKKHIMLPA